MKQLEQKMFDIHDVQFPVDNDLTIVIGENGTGKTELLHVLKNYYESQGYVVLHFSQNRIFSKKISDSLWYLLVEDTLQKYGVNADKLKIDTLEENYIYSGFHQIVNFFGTIMTQEEEKIIVLIDEVERNLSIEFQELLLGDLLNLTNVCKLIVTAHSPFVSDNYSSQMIPIGCCVKL